MEELVAIIFLMFGTIFGAILMWKFFDMVRNSIRRNRSNHDGERFERLARAFIDHRRETDRRLQNIETILSEDPALANGEQPQADALESPASRSRPHNENRQGAR